MKCALVLIAIALLMPVVAGLTRAQDAPAPPTEAAAAQARVSVESPGEDADSVLKSLAEQLGLRLRLEIEDADFLIDRPVWIRLRDAAPDEACLLAGRALGRDVFRDEVRGELVVRDAGSPMPGARVKGYDVSIPAGRFLDYVNLYGKEGENSAAGPGYTATEYLAEALSGMLGRSLGRRHLPSAFGDRLIYAVPELFHGRVEEMLALLTAEQGGESRDLVRCREIWQRLRSAAAPGLPVDGTVADALAAICAAAGADFVLDAEVARELNFLPADLQWDAASAADAIARLLRDLPEPVTVTSACGALVFCVPEDELKGPARVYELRDLLKRADQSFRRQRTAPGRERSYHGDLSSEGGMDLVTRVIAAELADLSHSVEMIHYGTRVIMFGMPETLAAVDDVLRAMGWEPPAEEP
jgi:hypothetical protein